MYIWIGQSFLGIIFQLQRLHSKWVAPVSLFFNFSSFNSHSCDASKREYDIHCVANVYAVWPVWPSPSSGSKFVLSVPKKFINHAQNVFGMYIFMIYIRAGIRIPNYRKSQNPKSLNTKIFLFNFGYYYCNAY